MKKIILSAVFCLSATISISAQFAVTSIQNKQTELLVNDSISIKKGDSIKIYLPAGKDFLFVKQKKSGLTTKILGQVADITATGAATAGMTSDNIKILHEATKVLSTANAVQHGVNAIEKIQDLPISKNAKKIAGKNMEVIDWEFREDSWYILTQLQKKKYEIYLQEAVMAQEIKLK